MAAASDPHLKRELNKRPCLKMQKTMKVSAETVSRFNAFTKQAKTLLSAPVVNIKPEPHTHNARQSITEFESFIAQAKPIVVQQIRATLRAHRSQLTNLCRWVVPQSCDVLAVAGLRGHEDRYTNLIAWMLWPEGKPELALRCQKAWLKSLGLHKIAMQMKKAIKPVREFVTKNGRPDMVMHFQQPDFILIVEAKTVTEEHETPNSDLQTRAYPAAVRERLGLPKNHPGAMVFLTRDGREADNSNAIVTTYELLVTVVAASLSPDEISHNLRWAYSSVITHFLTHAVPSETDKVEAMRLLANNIPLQQERLSNDQILDNLSILGPLCRICRNLDMGNNL
jgi:hypothetical protein